jgi:hypothetical protein
MPGNEKRTGSQAPDPDPAPYLYLTFEMKRNDMAKPYDPKRYIVNISLLKNKAR